MHRTSSPALISLASPLDELLCDDDEGGRVEQHKGAVRQVVPVQPVQTAMMRATDDPLAMELPVHLRRRRKIDAETLGPG